MSAGQSLHILLWLGLIDGCCNHIAVVRVKPEERRSSMGQKIWHLLLIQTSLKELDMSRLCLLSEPVCAKLNVTEDSAALPTKIMQMLNRGGQKKTLNPILPVTFCKHKTYPSVNTGSRTESLAAERQTCKQHKLSGKKLLHSRNKTPRMGI